MANAKCAYEKVNFAGLRACYQLVWRLQTYGLTQKCRARSRFCGFPSTNSAMNTKLKGRLHHSCSKMRFSGTTSYIQKYSLAYGSIYGRQISDAPYYTSEIVVAMQDTLLHINNISGLPWWTTIMSITIVLRILITFPLARHQAVTVAKMELVQPMINEIIEALKHNMVIRGKRMGKPPEEVNREFRIAARSHVKGIYKREKCNPLKLYVLPWIQLPLWIVISLALRNISGFFPRDTIEKCFCHPDLPTGGFSWISDLSISDPYYILPAIIGIANLLNIEMNSLRRKEPSKQQVIITRLFRTLTIAMVFFASQVPSAMSLYWATSSIYGLVQNLALMQPGIRRLLRIPKSPTESKTPIKDKLDIFMSRVKLFINIQKK